MTKIEEMLKGVKVEWKKLGEVAQIIKGKQFNKRDMLEEASYPVINGGISVSGYVEIYNQEACTITISQGGASAGYVNYIETKFWLGAHAYAIIPTNFVINRYLFHFLKMNQEKLQSYQEGAGIPSVSKDVLFNLKVPIPSLETQEKIAKTLDKFTNYVTELKAELKAREKQYFFYRDKLLSEEYLMKICTKIELKRDYQLRYHMLSELLQIRNGYTPSKSNKKYWESGDIPWFKMEDLRQRGNILSDSNLHVTKEAVKGELFKSNSIILSTSATIGEHALITNDFLANQRFTCFTLQNEFIEKIDMKFIFYYFYIIDEWCKNNVKIGNFPSVDIDNLLRQQIPIPHISIQLKIVAVLDKFQELLSDTKGLLPQEIDQRQKQYEYYRDKLLTFDTECGNTHTHTHTHTHTSNL